MQYNRCVITKNGMRMKFIAARNLNEKDDVSKIDKNYIISDGFIILQFRGGFSTQIIIYIQR